MRKTLPRVINWGPSLHICLHCISATNASPKIVDWCVPLAVGASARVVAAPLHLARVRLGPALATEAKVLLRVVVDRWSRWPPRGWWSGRRSHDSLIAGSAIETHVSLRTWSRELI